MSAPRKRHHCWHAASGSYDSNSRITITCCHCGIRIPTRLIDDPDGASAFAFDLRRGHGKYRPTRQLSWVHVSADMECPDITTTGATKAPETQEA
jgi:hypothetical protein